jgi:hypothetical protein
MHGSFQVVLLDFRNQGCKRNLEFLILLNVFSPNLLLNQYLDIFENTVSGLKTKGPGTS